MKVWGEKDGTGGIVHQNICAAAEALGFTAEQVYPAGNDTMLPGEVVRFIRVLSVLVGLQAQRIQELEAAVFEEEPLH